MRFYNSYQAPVPEGLASFIEKQSPGTIEAARVICVEKCPQGVYNWLTGRLWYNPLPPGPMIVYQPLVHDLPTCPHVPSFCENVVTGFQQRFNTTMPQWAADTCFQGQSYVRQAVDACHDSEFCQSAIDMSKRSISFCQDYAQKAVETCQSSSYCQQAVGFGQSMWSWGKGAFNTAANFVADRLQDATVLFDAQAQAIANATGLDPQTVKIAEGVIAATALTAGLYFLNRRKNASSKIDPKTAAAALLALTTPLAIGDAGNQCGLSKGSVQASDDKSKVVIPAALLERSKAPVVQAAGDQQDLHLTAQQRFGVTLKSGSTKTLAEWDQHISAEGVRERKQTPEGGKKLGY